MYGNGNYFGSAADAYNDYMDNGWMYRAKIDPRARVLSVDDTRVLAKAADVEDKALYLFARDNGKASVLDGYDVIQSTGRDGYTVVLNQRAVIVDRRSLPDGEWEERWNAMARANKAAIEEADNAYNVALQKLSGIDPDPEDVEAMVAALTHKNEVEAAVPNVRTFFKDLINELGDEGAGVGGLG